MNIRPTFLRTLIFATALIIGVSPPIDAQETSQKIPVDAHENIEIMAKHGNFSVSGWDENFVSVIGQTNEQTELTRANSILILKFEPAASSANNDQLEIKIPSTRKVTVTSGDANFSFVGLNPKAVETTLSSKEKVQRSGADISVSSVNGDVRIANSSGNFNVQTVNGDIEIVDSRGVANIRTFSGKQNIDADFRSVSSSNVSGESVYKLRTLDKLNLSNVNGNTTVESAVTQGASIQIQSVKGNVTLLVPETTSARFSLKSHQGGEIENTFKERIINSNQDDGAHVFSLVDTSSSSSISINTMDGNINVGPQEEVSNSYDDESYDWSSVDTSLLDFAFVNPNYNVLDYQEIFIKQPEIHFAPSWKKKFNGAKKGLYQKRIADEYSDLFKAAIANTFSETMNFKIIDQRKENALVVIPKILELYIDDPESVEIKDVFTASRAGNARIDLVVFSPSDSSILALFMDKRSTTRPKGIPFQRSRVRNSRAFSLLFNDWVEDIAKVLKK